MPRTIADDVSMLVRGTCCSSSTMPRGSVRCADVAPSPNESITTPSSAEMHCRYPRRYVCPSSFDCVPGTMTATSSTIAHLIALLVAISIIDPEYIPYAPRHTPELRAN